MSHSTWFRSLLPGVIALCCLHDAQAGDLAPDGLPHETVVLRDGRRLSGYYDPVSAILWIDGPYRARLRLRQGDVIRRTPIAEAAPRAESMAISATAGGAPRLLTIRLREQQLAEIDRRRQETGESIRLLTTTVNSLEGLLSDIGRTLGDHPDPVANAPLIIQQQQLRQQIGDLRRRLTLLDEQAAALTKRREQAAQVLTRARSLPGSANEPAFLVDPMIELRLQALEEEVRALRADNQDLHRQLERLNPAPIPVQPPAPPATATPPATVPTPTPPPAATPAPVEDQDDELTAERVARR